MHWRSTDLIWERLRDVRVRTQQSARARVAHEYELPLREALIQPLQTIEPRIQNLAWLAQVHGPHLEATERIVAEQIVDIRPRELERCGGVVMEGYVRQFLKPVVEELRNAWYIDVGLYKGVIEPLVRNIDLGNAQDVVDVAYDAYSGCGD